MRKIRFKGLTKKKYINNKPMWVYGYICTTDVDRVTIICIGNDLLNYSYEVDPETVGEYIGFDVNGQQLFEGDIVGKSIKSSSGKIHEFNYEIIFDEGSFKLKSLIDGNILPIDYLIDRKDYEYIGNIHDDNKRQNEEE